MEDNVHRPQEMGTWVLINVGWYKPLPAPPEIQGAADGIDRTPKLYIGGKQARPDSGYSQAIVSTKGKLLAHVGIGNRKDIRNAVEAARKNTAWAGVPGHGKAQILYFLGENLSARADEFAARIRALTGATAKAAGREVAASIDRLFSYGAWADKFDGAVHDVPLRGVVMAMHEPLGVMGLICPERLPLLGFISLLAPTIAMGNRVVIVPSWGAALVATDFYQVLDTSDVPGGVVNIVTGDGQELAEVLAAHDEVDAVWYHGSNGGSKIVEAASIGNLKRTWVNNGLERDWFDTAQGEGRAFLRQSTQVKNVWTPYGD
jgi:aldehyde dehydrogenase (NAD+)